jgi:ABC-type Mn2+/Zn2+ transport system ATPase subunit
MGEPLIKFEHASLGYGGAPVLADAEFEIQPRSFVGILGHNGSGKTTLLKTILGLVPCMKGRLASQGPDSAPLRFGYVPQKERLDPIFPLSAYDVAAMGTFRKLEPFCNVRGKTRKELIERRLAECGASELAGKAYRDLSGGQKQRVLIARALAADPDILALDEPLAGIDITTQKSLLQLLQGLREQGRLTILMVSHRIQAEKGLFTHIIWCDDGRAAMGPAEEMLSNGRLSEVFKSEL